MRLYLYLSIVQEPYQKYFFLGVFQHRLGFILACAFSKFLLQGTCLQDGRQAPNSMFEKPEDALRYQKSASGVSNIPVDSFLGVEYGVGEIVSMWI